MAGLLHVPATQPAAAVAELHIAVDVRRDSNQHLSDREFTVLVYRYVAGSGGDP